MSQTDFFGVVFFGCLGLFVLGGIAMAWAVIAVARKPRSKTGYFQGRFGRWVETVTPSGPDDPAPIPPKG